MSFPVLMYHRIGRVRSESSVPGHYVSERLLTRQLRLMRTLGFRSVDLAEATEHWRAGRPPAPKTYGITFDDGFRSFRTGAMPVLAKHGETATVFLVTDLMGRTNEWNRIENDVEEPLMSWDEASEARAAGHGIGSHTRTHLHLGTAPIERAIPEIDGSFAAISERFGGCPLFCYPYGGVRPETRDAVERAGYRAAFVTAKRFPATGFDPYRIPRINVRSDTPPTVLLAKLLRGGCLRRS